MQPIKLNDEIIELFGERLNVFAAKYIDNDSLALIVQTDTQEPYATLTVNVEHAVLDKYEFIPHHDCDTLFMGLLMEASDLFDQSFAPQVIEYGWVMAMTAALSKSSILKLENAGF